jgi:hypothetical protein
MILRRQVQYISALHKSDRVAPTAQKKGFAIVLPTFCS